MHFNFSFTFFHTQELSPQRLPLLGSGNESSLAMADAPANGVIVVNGANNHANNSATNSVNGRDNSKAEMAPPDAKGDNTNTTTPAVVVKGEKIPQLRSGEQGGGGGGGRTRDNAAADVNATPNIKSGKDRAVASSRPSSRGADR